MSFVQKRVVINTGDSVVLKTNMPYLPLSYESSNELIAYVSHFGRVVAVKEGIVTITASYFGKTTECIVRVK